MFQLEIITRHVINRACTPRNLEHSVTGLADFDIVVQCIGDFRGHELFRGTHTVTVQQGVITVEYGSCCWISDFGSGDWRIFTTLNLTAPRADTGEYNSSPETTVPLRLILRKGCTKFRIPVTDPNGDKVECREAMGTSECGDQCTYNSQRPGTITSDCIMDFSAGPHTPTGGPYIVNLVIEDLDASNTKLSLVFAQFIMYFEDVPPTELTLVSVEPLDKYIDTSGPTAYTATFDKDVFPTTLGVFIKFVDSVTGQVYHTIDASANLGQLQYLGRRLIITPLETFSDPMYEGKHISLLLDKEVALTGEVCQGGNMAITNRTAWFVHIGK